MAKRQFAMKQQENFSDLEQDESSLQVHKSARVPDDCLGKRLDQVAAALFNEFSRSRLQQWIKTGQLRVNGQQASSKQKLLGGEQLQIEASIAEEGEWQAENIPLNIVYEDDQLLVINKDADLVVHPAAGNYSGTVLNGLLFHCPQLAAVPRAGIVHRLDKDTTGLMVVAKTLQAHTHLVNQLQMRSVKRVYQALITGALTGGGTQDQPIGRHPRQRVKMAVVPDGKEARTHYAVMERFSAHTHIQLKLETGRTHQIRVHMAHLGYPLIGDKLYGGRCKTPRGASSELVEAIRDFDRQALHAIELGLIHPSSGEMMQWKTALPDDFQTLLNLLRNEK